MTTEQWPEVGDKVAIYDGDRWTPNVQFATVAKLTATQIVTNTGDRYRRDNLRRVGGGGDLRRPDDAVVRSAVARRALDHMRFAVDKAVKDFRGNADDALDLIDHLADLIEQTRKRITDPVA